MHILQNQHNKKWCYVFYNMVLLLMATERADFYGENKE